MTYTALARKWRPRTFSELLGQDSIKKILINSLEQNRIHHAYLFTGTRGVGKTSVARLFAKSLNCELRISASPCLQCNNCIAIEQGQFMDLVEVDGASRTRVEDTRDLLENIQYVPTTGRFKIYLIDEVHMLSNHSFNALLKTLEEPPEHVKFLLATTDPQKLPITVLSRCLQFNLKHLQDDVINTHLQSILKTESIDYDVDGLMLISKAARGSVRDALSLLDQAIVGSDGKLTTIQVKDLLGYSQQDYALQILDALSRLDSHSLLSVSQKISAEGGHFQFVLNELIQYLHQICIYQTISNDQAISSNAETILSLAQILSPEDVQLFYQIALNNQGDLHLAPTPAIAFDMILLRMYAFRPSEVPTRLPLAYERSTPLVSPHAVSIEEKSAAAVASLIIEPEPQTTQAQAESLPIYLTEQPSWLNILPQLNIAGLALSAAENAELLEIGDNHVTLQINKGHGSLFSSSVVGRIEDALSTLYNRRIKLDLKTTDKLLSTPATEKQLAIANGIMRAKDSLESDPIFQKLNHEFSAELVKTSITPVKDDL